MMFGPILALKHAKHTSEADNRFGTIYYGNIFVRNQPGALALQILAVLDLQQIYAWQFKYRLLHMTSYNESIFTIINLSKCEAV